MRFVCMFLLVGACVTNPVSGDEAINVNSTFAFDGYTWSGGDKIQFYAWLPSAPDSYDAGLGSWYPYALFSATSSNTVAASFFNKDLYVWSTSASIPWYLWEAGYIGSQVYVKARSTNHNRDLMTFDDTGTAVSCLSQTGDWIEYLDECASHRSPAIRLETADFVPWADRGMVDCPHNEIAGCTLCVDDVVASFQDVFRGQLMGPMNAYESNTYNWVANGVLGSNHIQGIARLANVDLGGGSVPNGTSQPLQGRTVISRDRPAELGVFEEFTYAQNQQPELASTISHLWDPIPINTALDHPGGIWAAGDVVAVPVGCADCNTTYNEVIFYHADGYDLTEINRLVLNGSQGEPGQNVNDFVQSVAFTKLRGGRFLLFVANSYGGYFYVSDREEIESATNWTFINDWTPDCVDGTSVNPLCFGGAASSTMFTQCDGRVFIGALHGERHPGTSPVLSWVTVMEVVQSHITGTISLVQRDRRFVEGRNGPGNEDVSMFWGGTTHVTERGTLITNATGRDFDGDELRVERAVDCNDQLPCP